MSKKCSVYLLTVAICLVPVMVCAAAKDQSKNNAQAVIENKYPGIFVEKVDNFIIVLDGSMSMTDEYKGRDKLDIAKGVINQMNLMLPDLELTGAFRLCGMNSCPEEADSQLIYGPKSYSKSELSSVIAGIERASGGTPMNLTIEGVKGDLASLDGNSAVILISDGIDVQEDAVEAVADLKRAYGDQLAFYVLQVGDNALAADVLNDMAFAGGSERAYAAVDLAESNQKMANFLETVFLAEASDTDGDGVFDYFDKCPNTPANAAVDDQGCRFDHDKDGVPDDMDSCHGTPKGAKVDSRGCWSIGTVHFDFDKSEIKSSAHPVLNNVMDVMQNNSNLNIIIDGHTDNIGKAEYNMNLSHKRAASAMKYLVEHGISSDRIEIKAFGFTKPAVSNDTEEGRAKNRRVEFRPAGPSQ